jgi:predicted DNA-binding transcriptional regulator YafY
MAVDPLERLTNLVALLLESRVPLTLNDIQYRLVGQYADNEDARRGAFERDKRVLKEVGIPLRQTVLTGDQAGQTGYWIERSEYELEDLRLDDDERRALQVALAAVHIGPNWADDAILKLGGSTLEESSSWTATLDASENVPILYGASTERQVVRFSYRGEAREVEPWGIVARNGFWYLIGLDRRAGERRTYRVDRMENVVAVGNPNAFDRPADFDPAAALQSAIESIGAQEGVTEARVLIDAPRALAAEMELGAESVAERRPDGSIVVKVPCRNRLVFRAWVLGFVEHAEVLGPPEVREEIVSWLEAMVPHA